MRAASGRCRANSRVASSTSVIITVTVPLGSALTAGVGAPERNGKHGSEAELYEQNAPVLTARSKCAPSSGSAATTWRTVL